MGTFKAAAATLPSARVFLSPITLTPRSFWFCRRDEGSVEQRRREVRPLRRGCVNIVRHVERLISQTSETTVSCRSVSADLTALVGLHSFIQKAPSASGYIYTTPRHSSSSFTMLLSFTSVSLLVSTMHCYLAFLRNLDKEKGKIATEKGIVHYCEEQDQRGHSQVRSLCEHNVQHREASKFVVPGDCINFLQLQDPDPLYSLSSAEVVPSYRLVRPDLHCRVSISACPVAVPLQASSISHTRRGLDIHTAQDLLHGTLNPGRSSQQIDRS
jgi:hypothetical protein